MKNQVDKNISATAVVTYGVSVTLRTVKDLKECEAINRCKECGLQGDCYMVVREHFGEHECRLKMHFACKTCEEQQWMIDIIHPLIETLV